MNYINDGGEWKAVPSIKSVANNNIYILSQTSYKLNIIKGIRYDEEYQHIF